MRANVLGVRHLTCTSKAPKGTAVPTAGAVMHAERGGVRQDSAVTVQQLMAGLEMHSRTALGAQSSHQQLPVTAVESHKT